MKKTLEINVERSRLYDKVKPKFLVQPQDDFLLMQDLIFSVVWTIIQSSYSETTIIIK